MKKLPLLSHKVPGTLRGMCGEETGWAAATPAFIKERSTERARAVVWGTERKGALLQIFAQCNFTSLYRIFFPNWGRGSNKIVYWQQVLSTVFLKLLYNERFSLHQQKQGSELVLESVLTVLWYRLYYNLIVFVRWLLHMDLIGSFFWNI